MKSTISVPVHLGSEEFRSFALFDTFIKGRRWQNPVIFGGILLLSALACFCKGGTVLAIVLSVLALGLPAVYFGCYLGSVAVQCRKSGLKNYPLVYTVTFGPKEIQVQTETEQAVFRYKQLHAVYRRSACIYLYVHPRKAFILPAADIEGGTRVLWEELKKTVPAQILFDGKGR